jgi:putative ABC transport system permease protein
LPALEVGVSSLVRDVRYGLRMLRRAPGFTAVAVFALALGIAANTAIFSVVHATLLAPLPFPNPDQIVMVWSRIQGNRNGVSAGDFVEWRRQATVFQSINAWTGRNLNLATADRPENVQGRAVTPGWLSMVGYDFALGRNFREDEGIPGQDRVLILANRLWRERFNADPDIVGKQVRIDGRPSTVVGVLAPGPGDRLENVAWVPLAFTPDQLNHDFHWILVMGRLKPGVTLAQANENMVAVANRLAEMYPESNKGWTASVELLQNNFLDGEFITGLWLLLGAVGFVLLIACANVANLLLARGTSRQQELAVRSALGATRAGIVRQFIVESAVLAVIGGIAGVALAAGLHQLIMALMPANTLPSEADVRLNVPVLLFTVAACALSGLLFGAAPAWQGSRVNINSALKESGRSVAPGRHRLQRALVVVEFGLALTLLAGGGLAVSGLLSLSRVNLGFQTESLLTFALPVPQGRLTGHDTVTTFYSGLLERVGAVPGVVSASVSTGMPVLGTGFGMPFHFAGRPPGNPSERQGAGFNMVSPGYFETFGIRMSKGRPFTPQDRAGSMPVAIVNQTFVDRFLKDVDPLTQRIVIEQLIPGETRLGPPVEWQIVGVYGDVRNAGPRNDGFPEIDVPFLQSSWPSTRVAVRTLGDPTAATQSLAAAVRAMDADLPMADVKTMEQRVYESIANDRFNTLLFGTFAGVALLLAAVGIYGVMSFVVAERRQEIGIRLALGAGRPRVLRSVLRDGMLTAVAGTALGSIGAYFVGRAMEGLVYGVGRVNWATFTVVALTLTATALVACLVPASRAARVDPLVALREG